MRTITIEEHFATPLFLEGQKETTLPGKNAEALLKI
ncbi:hypothetical protein SAMN04488122_3486 [Chitinophaga arvensicola]|uniref:Uncharacterized protein n=1 Tax=Chitinophaga arvensicola TaxID=29529 RepID=A0A1I0RVW4_9BACT|nr:hypothetical protein SAMN04488122_3486 [Chitinophaga arvensicola]